MCSFAKSSVEKQKPQNHPKLNENAALKSFSSLPILTPKQSCIPNPAVFSTPQEKRFKKCLTKKKEKETFSHNKEVTGNI